MQRNNGSMLSISTASLHGLNRIREMGIDVSTLNLLQNENLDFNKIEDLFMRNWNSCLKAKEKDLVILIGNTGSGKSTLVNYLLGNELEKQVVRGAKVMYAKNADESRYPKIGHSTLAETLFPMIYEDLDSELFYCDCPGFQENRGVEEQICGEIGIQLAVRLSQSVKAIIVVVNSKELDAVKGDGFAKLNNMLVNLFTSLSEIVKSFLFVFTKVDNDELTRENIIDQIDQRITDQLNLAENKSSSYYYDDSTSENEKYLNFLQLIKDNPERIFVVNYNDSNSRQELRKLISKVNERITSGDFDFDANYDTRVKFNKFIYKVAHDGTCLIENKVTWTNFISQCDEELKRLNERVSFYEAELLYLGGSFTMRSNEQRTNATIVKANADKIKAIEGLKRTEEHRLSNAVDEIHVIERELNYLKSDEVVLYWKDTVYEKRFKIPLLGTKIGQTRKVFEYRDVAFERVEWDKENGVFEIKEEKKALGRYKAIYRSDPKKDGMAWVKIYIKKKNRPDIKRLIHFCDGRLKKKNNEKLNIEEKIRGYDAEIKRLISVGDKKDSIHDRQRFTFKNDLESCKLKIESLNEEQRKSENILLDCENKLASKAELFNFVALVSEIIEFTSPLVEEFIALKKKHIDSVNNRCSMQENDIPDNFICPIKQDLMEDPMSTPCGHRFDRMDIINYFRNSGERVLNINCPICRTEITENDLKPDLMLKAIITRWKSEKYRRLKPTINTDDLTREQLVEKQIELETQMKHLELQLDHLQIEYKTVIDRLKQMSSNLSEEQQQSD